MTTGMICIITVSLLTLITIILGIKLTKSLNNIESIELVNGKLENSDLYIKDSLSYLKITNEWKE